jgi:hypothetical protein
VPATWLLAVGPGGLVLAGQIDRRRLLGLVGSSLLAVLLLFTMSCGGQSIGTIPSAVASSSHSVTIHGDAGSTHLSTTVAISVN